MARNEQADFQLYFSRVRPIYHRLFNLAHAVTGNAEQAAYCVQYAMLDCWAAGDASASMHGFREGLRGSTLRAALTIAGTEDVPFDWDGLRAGEEEPDPLLRRISREEVSLRRMLALRHGCALSCRRIAKLLGERPGSVQARLRRFEAQARRELSGTKRRASEADFNRAIRGRMSRPSPLAPEMGGVFRGFQADAASVNRPSRLPGRILHGILTALFALLCIVAFWLAAVLVQPAVIEEPAQAVTETASELAQSS